MSRVCIAAHVIVYSSLNFIIPYWLHPQNVFIADKALTHLTEEIYSVLLCGVSVDKLL